MNRDELKKRIGSLIVTGWDTPEPSASFLAFAHSAAIGGVVLFAEQCTTSTLTRANLALLKRQLSYPPLVAIDQEGGRVCRIKGRPAEYDAASEYGRTKDVERYIQEFSRAAMYLESIGVNLLLGPVADIFVNKRNSCLAGRCFGTDPGTVSLFVEQTIIQAHQAGLLCCLKHFPGLGDAQVDPHFGLAEADYKYGQWLKRERIPFADGVAKGADAVMTTHLRLTSFENEIVTGSQQIISSLLRQELDFDGVLITDDLTMEGAAELGNFGERTLKAFLAGHDLLLFGRNWRAAQEAYERLLLAFDTHEITPERLTQSLERLTSLRFKLDQLSVSSHGAR